MASQVYSVYPSDLNDAEWALLSPLIPAAKPGGRPRSVQIRRILNGILYVLRTGGAWESGRYLPAEDWSVADRLLLPAALAAR